MFAASSSQSSNTASSSGRSSAARSSCVLPASRIGTAEARASALAFARSRAPAVKKMDKPVTNLPLIKATTFKPFTLTKAAPKADDKEQ